MALVDVEERGGRLQVADGEPAGCAAPPAVRCPSGRGAARRRVRPRTPRRPPARSTRAAARSVVASVGDDVDRVSVVVRPPRRASPTSPGSTTAPPARGTSSRRESSSSAGVAASSGSTVCRAVPVVRLAAVPGDVLEQGPRGGGQLGEPGRHLGGRSRVGAPGAQAAGAWPAEGVGHAGQRAQPAGGLPDQREVERAARGRRRRASRSAWTIVAQLGRGGLTRDDEGIKDRELEPRQTVERTRPPRCAPRLETRADRSREGREWPDRVVRGAAGTAGRPASRAAGRRASGCPVRRAILPTLPRGACMPMTGVELHHGAATDVGLVREVNEDAFLVAPPVFVVADGMGGHDRGDVASGIVVEEFARLADAGYDPTAAPSTVAETLRRCQARIAAYDAEQRAGGAHDFAAGTTAVVALLIEQERAQVAARQPRRLADLPLRPRRARAGQRRPQRRAGARRRRRDHRRRRRRAPRAAHHHPRPGGCRQRRGRLLRAAAVGGGAAGALLRRRQRDDRRRGRSPGSWPSRPTRATPPTRSSRRPWRPGGATTPPPSSWMWWDWPPRRRTTPSAARESRAEAGSAAMTDERPSGTWSYRAGAWFGVFGPAHDPLAARQREGTGGRSLVADRRRRRASTTSSTGWSPRGSAPCPASCSSASTAPMPPVRPRSRCCCAAPGCAWCSRPTTPRSSSTGRPPPPGSSAGSRASPP